jgi:hypothetical protein
MVRRIGGRLQRVVFVLKTMRDADFIADAKNLEIDVEPMNAADTKAVVERLFATPPAVVARIEDALLQ